MRSSAQLKELINATRLHINLMEPVIEKDYYVTHVIHELSSLENEYFRLIFTGGTSLAKAHRVVRRMSEDVDFKIQSKQDISDLSKARQLKYLKEFRNLIQSRLKQLDLNANDPVTLNEGRYSQVEINYFSCFSRNEGLRPHILLEFTLSEVRQGAVALPVRALIEDNLKDVLLFPSHLISCTTVDETALEKWVGLTRRISAIERGYQSDDKSLVRHVYDLNSILQLGKIQDSFFSMAKEIMMADAEQFQRQHPEYFLSQRDEVTQSLLLLRSKEIWKERYQEFVETMVFDDAPIMEYDRAIGIIEQISQRVIDTLI
jgi:hypothetical protein